MKITRKRIIIGAVIAAAVMAVCFFCLKDVKTKSYDEKPSINAENKSEEKPKDIELPGGITDSGGNAAGNEESENGAAKNVIGGSEKTLPESGAENEKESIKAPQKKTEEQKEVKGKKKKGEVPESVQNKQLSCTLSVRCDTILDNIKALNPEKIELVPKNGVIFEARSVVFYEGESAFNVLLREMKKNKIHLEFVNTPIYNSAYIEGIANLYELDCGELSGWLYSVNGSFPNCGCSRYKLKNGDKLEFVYTCDLGADVGAVFKEGEGQRDE